MEHATVERYVLGRLAQRWVGRSVESKGREDVGVSKSS